MTSLETHLKIIEERLDKATPGPWRIHGPYVVLYNPESLSTPIERKDRPTAEFIAHSPQDIRQLIDACRVMIKGLDKIYQNDRLLKQMDGMDFEYVDQVWNQSRFIRDEYLSAASKCFEGKK